MNVEELLARASRRTALKPADSKSGLPLERVVVDGESFVVKHLHVDDDWIMRTLGDLRCQPLTLWRSGLLDRMPAVIDHTMVAVAGGRGRNGWGAVIVMRDVGPWLVPEGDALLPAPQHAGFLAAMAALHAAMWAWRDDVGLLPLTHRYHGFGPHLGPVERALGNAGGVPPLTVEGWERFAERVGGSVGRVVLEQRAGPWALIDAMERTPCCFVQGDWKAGNLGMHDDGRTILLDWAHPGSGPPLGELLWYLALNAARLPESKEDCIERYREALVRSGVDVTGWFDRQLDLCALGALVQFGWEKALGADDELGWWVERAAPAARALEATA